MVPVAEHHDGFSMYDSGLSDWTAVKMGQSATLIGELAKEYAPRACTSASPRIAPSITSSSTAVVISLRCQRSQICLVVWPCHKQWKGTPTAHDGRLTYVSPAWTADWMARMTELVEKYKPEIVYYDWWIGQPNFRSRYRSSTPSTTTSPRRTVIRAWSTSKTTAWTGSRRARLRGGQLAAIEPDHWQTDTSISKLSWATSTHTAPEFLIHQSSTS